MRYQPKHAKPKPAGRAKAVGGAVAVSGALGVLGATPAAAASLSPDAVAAYARQGCPSLTEQQVTVAVKIAGAESGRNPSAHNPYGEDSRGLWQINVAAHGSPWGNLYDPLTNAKAMCDISGKGRNWGPWTMYTNGMWRSQPGPSGAVTSPPVAPSRPVTAPVKPSPKLPVPSGPTVTVKPGDTLWGLSPGHDWKPVCEKNRLADCDLIYPGQRITL